MKLFEQSLVQFYPVPINSLPKAPENSLQVRVVQGLFPVCNVYEATLFRRLRELIKTHASWLQCLGMFLSTFSCKCKRCCRGVLSRHRLTASSIHTALDLLCTASKWAPQRGLSFLSSLPLVGHVLANSKMTISLCNVFLKSWKSSQKGLVTETNTNKTS